MTTRKAVAHSEHFRRLAAEQAREASATRLPSVRERCLQAERSLLAMAERAEAVETHRRERAARTRAGPPRPRRRRFG